MIIADNASGDVARTGIEPATQGFSVLPGRFRLLHLVTQIHSKRIDSIGNPQLFL